MKVLMLGWEFPPFFAGGVGMVCYELAKELSNNFKQIDVEYVMPYYDSDKSFSDNFKIKSANFSDESIKKYKNLNINITKIPSLIYSYDSYSNYEKRYKSIVTEYKNKLVSKNKTVKQLYGKNLLEEVELYSLRIFEKYKNSDFNIIHAHDWTTIPAALKLKEITNKPVVLHVHITELDKTGGNMGDPRVMQIERMGFEKADLLIAVSNFTKNRLINDYNVEESKIKVIHNGGITDLVPNLNNKHVFNYNEKVVLFTGRITLQKGVEYFIKAAQKVLKYKPDTKFIIAGTGDMLSDMIELATRLGIDKSIYFHGFYTRDEAEKLFSMADVFVMPSVSEPFGIVPLEAIAKGTPVILSKQSGVSEVLKNCFKVDFWDIDEMADNIVSLLNYPTLNNQMRKLAHREYIDLSWNKSVKKIIGIYNHILYN